LPLLELSGESYSATNFKRESEGAKNLPDFRAVFHYVRIPSGMKLFKSLFPGSRLKVHDQQFRHFFLFVCATGAVCCRNCFNVLVRHEGA